jgi:hypothetical protein
MTTMRIEKVNNVLPSTLSANTLYFVKNGNAVVSYVTDNTGTTAYQTNTTEDKLEPFLLMGATNA